MADSNLPVVGVNIVANGADVAEANIAKADAAFSKLDTRMQAVSKVAKEYGLSASEASKLVKQGAEESGVSMEVFANQVLADAEIVNHGLLIMSQGFSELPKNIERSVTESSSLLMEMLRTEGGTASSTAFAEQISEGVLEIGTAFQELPKNANIAITETNSLLMGLLQKEEEVSKASKTMFAEQMSGLSASGYDWFVTGLERAGQAGQKFEQVQQQTNAAVQTGIAAQNQYFQAQQQGTQATQQQTQAQVQQNIAMNQGNMALLTFGSEWQKVFLVLSSRSTPLQAITQINQLMGQGVTATQAWKQILDQAFESVLLNVKSTTQLSEVKQQLLAIEKELNAAMELETVAQQKLHERSIESSRAFFALTLASFGVMSITQELKKSFGDELPDAFEKTSNAIQQIASFGSAGAFIGGGPGAILGGIAGGLLAITTAAITLDPALQQVNTDLDNMSHRDETAKTLAEIADVSEDVANTWLEAARQDPNFAAYLEEVTKKLEPMPGLLAGVKAASDTLFGDTSAIEKFFGDIGETLNELLTLAGAVGVGFTVLQSLIQGGVNPLEAYNIATEKAGKFITDVVNATQKHNLTQEEANDITKRADAILADHEKMLEKAAAAQRKYNEAIAGANADLEALDEKTRYERGQAEQQKNNALADAHEQFLSQYAQAEQGLSNKLSDLWTSYTDKLADIQSDLSDKIADAQSQLQDRLYDIGVQLSNRLADIAQQLADKIADIQLDLQNKLRDLAHQRDNDINSENRKIEDAARDLARKLYEIERERLESINALDFNTKEQLRNATTEHDRQAILRRHQFEQGEIDRKANDARQDALYDFQQKVAQANKEKELARSTYEYEVALAKELANQKIAQARREAAQQEADARRTADQQIKQAEREAEQKRLIAEREAQQAQEQARRRYEEEIAQAYRARDQAIQAARQAEEARRKDIERTFEERNAAIQRSYELERKQIEATRIAAYQAYIEQLKLIGLVAEAWAQMYNNLQANYTELGKSLFLRGIEDFTPLPPELTHVGGAAGLDMEVPPGHVGDTYRIGARSGEHVTITPPGTSYTSSQKSVTVNIYDATDPVRVGKAVEKVLDNYAWR